MGFFHEIGSFLGVNSAKWASWWGGFASDIPEFGILIVLLRKFECHADGCHRIGMHHVAGTTFVTCRKHHPTNGNTVEAIHQAHADAQQRAA